MMMLMMMMMMVVVVVIKLARRPAVGAVKCTHTLRRVWHCKLSIVCTRAVLEFGFVLPASAEILAEFSDSTAFVKSAVVAQRRVSLDISEIHFKTDYGRLM